MKIHPECMRDLLLVIEKTCDLLNGFEYVKNNKPPELLNYLHDSIVYHAVQCNDAGLFKDFLINDACTDFYVSDLTPKGHALINQLRNDTVWNKVLKHGFSSVPDTILFLIDLLKQKYDKLTQ